MRLRIKIGDLEVITNGLDYTKRDVTRLLGEVAGIALALMAEDEPAEPTGANPIGFTAIVERAPEVETDYSEYFEDEDRSTPDRDR